MDLAKLAALPVGISNITLGSLVTAALTLLVCLVVVRLLVKLLTRVLGRSKLEPRVRRWVVSVIKAAAYGVTLIIVVDCLGVPITSLVALISVGSLGLTLAAEDILGNIAGGLIIVSSQPFSVGDFIEVGAATGTVEEISLHHTRLNAPDGQMISLPNKMVSDAQIINYTALGRRRIARKVTASYDAPTETVKAACLAAASATPDLLAEPAAEAFLSDFGSSSIEYTLYCWCLPGDYWRASFALSENLREAFRSAGVEMTYDHLNVHIEN